MTYSDAINLILSRRSDDLASADAFFKELLSSNEKFREAELAVREAELAVAYGKADKSVLAPLYKTRDEVVSSLGVSDKLYPAPRCKRCNDTGRVNGKYCSCVKTLALSSNKDNIEFDLHPFSSVDASLFNNDEIFVRTAKELELIAKKGEYAQKKNINLLGATGTGKTFLASCFAYESLEQGRTVTFITAFSFVSKTLAYHTTFNSHKEEHIAPLIESDILIIDDLGTESIFKNVTLEYLYHVINERQLNGKTTVITSNLTIDQLAVRYGERIISRLFDKKLCYAREFTAPDARKIKL